jgi:hypothetical protein
MDIQGAEGGAILGMSSVLRRNGKLKMITEFWPFGLKKFGIDGERYIGLLQEHGFTLFNINEHAKKIEPVNVSGLLSWFTPESEAFTNLLCIRR